MSQMKSNSSYVLSVLSARKVHRLLSELSSDIKTDMYHTSLQLQSTSREFCYVKILLIITVCVRRYSRQSTCESSISKRNENLYFFSSTN